MIDKISGISGMKNLRVLSLGRNYIKGISGLVNLLEYTQKILTVFDVNLFF